MAPLREAFLAQKEQQPLFLPTDTHWTPYGARLAAQELARQHPELVGSTPYTSRQVAQRSSTSRRQPSVVAGSRLMLARTSCRCRKS